MFSRQPSFPIWRRPLRFLDIETTGTDENIHEIVEIAIIDAQGKTCLHEKVLAERLETATEEALEINGYDELLWRRHGAKRWRDLATRVAAELVDTLPVGWRVDFDMRFIRAGVRQVCENFDDIPGRSIDVHTLAWEHLGVPKIAPVLSLAEACDVLGISNDGAHTTLVDAERARRVYGELLQAGALRRLRWRMGRRRGR